MSTFDPLAGVLNVVEELEDIIPSNIKPPSAIRIHPRHVYTNDIVRNFVQRNNINTDVELVSGLLNDILSSSNPEIISGFKNLLMLAKLEAGPTSFYTKAANDIKEYQETCFKIDAENAKKMAEHNATVAKLEKQQKINYVLARKRIIELYEFFKLKKSSKYDIDRDIAINFGFLNSNLDTSDDKKFRNEVKSNSNPISLCKRIITKYNYARISTACEITLKFKQKCLAELKKSNNVSCGEVDVPQRFLSKHSLETVSLRNDYVLHKRGYDAFSKSYNTSNGIGTYDSDKWGVEGKIGSQNSFEIFLETIHKIAFYEVEDFVNKKSKEGVFGFENPNEIINRF